MTADVIQREHSNIKCLQLLDIYRLQFPTI